MTPAKLVMLRAGSAEDPFADFRNFVHYLFAEIRGWSYVGSIQYDIAEWMQNLPIAKDGIRRGQVQSLRGAGKTEIAVAFCLWLLYLDPDIRILAVSSVLSKAQEFVALARQIIDQAPLLHHLKPLEAKSGQVDKDQKDNLHGFVVGAAKDQINKELSLASYPIFGTYTGAHPDVIVADDVETPENALTVGKRDKLLSKFFEFESLINPGGIILGLGTPQSEDSIYLKLRNRGYPIRRWPARAPDLRDAVASRDVSPVILKALEVGTLKPGAPTYPERFGEDALLTKLAIYGPSMFALQMMLDTTLADKDRYPLKLEDLIVMDLHPDMAPERVVWGKGDPIKTLDPQGLDGDFYYGPIFKEPKYADYAAKVMYIDPKGGGADTVGWTVGAALNGTIYTLAAGGFARGEGNDGTSDIILERLAKEAHRWGVRMVGVEDNFGDGMYAKLLRPVMGRLNGPTEVQDIHSKGQKELRIIDTLETLVSSHKLVVNVSVAKVDELWRQYTRITRARGSLAHDDLVESLAGMCRMLSDHVQLDPTKRVEQAREREKQDMVRAFQENAIGFVKTGSVTARPWTGRVASRWGRRPGQQEDTGALSDRRRVRREQARPQG